MMDDHKRIWLQTTDEHGETTWCQDKINDDDVEYIRADLNAALKEFVAIILCWKPEWAQTSYFLKLPVKLRDDLVELAKSTKQEGSGGINNEWLAALLADTQKKRDCHTVECGARLLADMDCICGFADTQEQEL